MGFVCKVTLVMGFVCKVTLVMGVVCKVTLLMGVVCKVKLVMGVVSLKLREERRLRVFEKRVLRRILGPERDDVKGEWRKLHNEELTQYCSGD